MKRIITLTGPKQSGKLKLAQEWGRNENVSFINPYTSNKKREQDMIYLRRDKLESKMKSDYVLGSTVVNGELYVIFQSQLANDWNVIIADDYLFSDILTNYNYVISVWVHNPKAEQSDRVNIMYSTDDFDYIFNYGLDSSDEFLEQLAFDVEMVQNG